VCYKCLIAWAIVVPAPSPGCARVDSNPVRVLSPVIERVQLPDAFSLEHNGTIPADVTTAARLMCFENHISLLGEALQQAFRDRNA
jgi:protein-arginine kinase activator protein McsA